MIILCNSKQLVNKVKIADTFIKRFIGLLGRSSMEKNEGLLLKNCSSIHCFFMKFTIDAIYLSKDMTIIEKETIRPWKIGKWVKKARHVLELKEGTAQDVKIGDTLILKEN